jgi:hypothetical protein
MKAPLLHFLENGRHLLQRLGKSAYLWRLKCLLPEEAIDCVLKTGLLHWKWGSNRIKRKTDASRPPQRKNRNATQAISTINAEYFSPATARPSPMTPAASPEKNPWISAAWQKTRL